EASMGVRLLSTVMVAQHDERQDRHNPIKIVRNEFQAMSDQIGSFGATAKGLARNPLGIIALFIVLVYGFASLVTAFAGSFTAEERLPLIYFLVLFPVLVLGSF